MTSSGPDSWVTARACSGLTPSSRALASDGRRPATLAASSARGSRNVSSLQQGGRMRTRSSVRARAIPARVQPTTSRGQQQWLPRTADQDAQAIRRRSRTSPELRRARPTAVSRRARSADTRDQRVIRAPTTEQAAHVAYQRSDPRAGRHRRRVSMECLHSADKLDAKDRRDSHRVTGETPKRLVLGPVEPERLDSSQRPPLTRPRGRGTSRTIKPSGPPSRSATTARICAMSQTRCKLDRHDTHQPEADLQANTMPPSRVLLPQTSSTLIDRHHGTRAFCYRTVWTAP